MGHPIFCGWSRENNGKSKDNSKDRSRSLRDDKQKGENNGKSKERSRSLRDDLQKGRQRQRQRQVRLFAVEVEGVEIAGGGAGADEGDVVGGDAAEEVVGGFSGVEAGEVGYLLELAAVGVDAIDGLGGRHEGVDVDGFAVGAPDGVGYAGLGEEAPGTGGDVEEHEAALVERDGGDVAAVGGPAGAEEAFGAGDRGDGVGAEVEDLDGAGAALLAHEVGDAAEDEGLAVGGPVGVGGVAVLLQEG